jgi:signal transduction histidine kinase
MEVQIVPFDHHLNSISDSANRPLENNLCAAPSKKLHHFFQLQIKQLTAHPAIQWAQIVYLDPLANPHRQVVQAAKHFLSQELVTYLQTEAWLIDFPPVLTLAPIASENLDSGFYFCPYGYQHQQCQYLLLRIEGTLSPGLQQLIQQTAVLLSNQLDLYSEVWQQSNQIQLLEQIVQRVGHQLRHPLSLIHLYAENLCHGLPQGQWQEQATIICEVAQDLDQNLSELLHCSCSEALRVTSQDLRSLVSESIQRFHAGIVQKRLSIQYPDASMMLNLDRAQMKQVFDNLLSNAIHFSPDGGTITWNWQIFHSEVLITIADSGPGLSSEDLQCLFNPFYSRRPGGVGLGLAIARKSVLDHQGNLWARNLSNQGAEFLMILPRANPSMTQQENDAC